MTDKWIYEELNEYQELNEADKLLFKLMYNYLILNGKITSGDDELSEVTGVAKTTLKRQLSRLAESRLIIRHTVTTKNSNSSSGYKSSRTIKLNPVFFPMFSFETSDKEIALNMYDWIVLLNDINTMLTRGIDDLKKLSREEVEKINRRLCLLGSGN